MKRTGLRTPLHQSSAARSGYLDGVGCGHNFGKYHTLIATSATLTTGGTFDFWLERVGAPEDTRTLQLSSPFDFRR